MDLGISLSDIYQVGVRAINAITGDNNEPVGLAGCSRELPSIPTDPAESTTSSVAPETTNTATAEPITMDYNSIMAYLNREESVRQQVIDQICVAPEPHYYIGTIDGALSQTSGRQGQTISNVIIYGAADDLDLSDSAVLNRLSISFGEGITVSNVRFENNQLVVDLEVTADAATGQRAVVISLQDANGASQTSEIGRLDEANGFTVRRRSAGDSRRPNPNPNPQPSGFCAQNPTDPMCNF